jgi:hypothetical protein
MATQEQVTISRPAPYLEAAGQTYLDLLTAKTGQAPTAAELQGMSPQVAGQNVLTQQAQQQAATQAGLGALTFDPTTGAVTGAGQGTGVAGYQPFLQQAQQYSGPQAYQQFMSPYQQDVINTTLLNMIDRDKLLNKESLNKPYKLEHLVVEEKGFNKQNLELSLYKIEQHYRHNYYNKDINLHNKLQEPHSVNNKHLLHYNQH